LEHIAVTHHDEYCHVADRGVKDGIRTGCLEMVEKFVPHFKKYSYWGF